MKKVGQPDWGGGGGEGGARYTGGGGVKRRLQYTGAWRQGPWRSGYLALPPLLWTVRFSINLVSYGQEMDARSTWADTFPF